MTLIGELYKPSVAILPIGDHYTMGPFQAAHACRLLGVAHVFPGHWGTFPLLTGTPAISCSRAREPRARPRCACTR